MNSIDLLAELIRFPTVSCNPNTDLIGFVADFLGRHGIDSEIIRNASGHKANLYATIGPKDRPGVMLSGHTDVVPVDGQDWSVPPFELTEREGKLYGRGAADMKGFVACALSVAAEAARRELQTPLHLALSYDEEVGCLGVHGLIDLFRAAPFRPRFGIVGEPTELAVATGHKGKTELKVRCTSREAHSALAPLGVNAIHMASDFIEVIRRKQADIIENGARDGDYDVSYTTLHVGRIGGGVALNIVPNHCELEFEIRNLAVDDPEAILADLRIQANRIVDAARAIAPEAGINIDISVAFPGLDTPPTAPVVEFVKALTGANGTIKVSYGTEAGLFNEVAGIPMVVCGPGSMAQGHKPDEYVTREQIARCDAMLDKLIANLEAGN